MTWVEQKAAPGHVSLRVANRRDSSGITVGMVDVATFGPLLYSVETRIRDRVFRDLMAIPFEGQD
jgi:hypothetical protein